MKYINRLCLFAGKSRRAQEQERAKRPTRPRSPSVNAQTLENELKRLQEQKRIAYAVYRSGYSLFKHRAAIPSLANLLHMAEDGQVQRVHLLHPRLFKMAGVLDGTDYSDASVMLFPRICEIPTKAGMVWKCSGFRIIYDHDKIKLESLNASGKEAKAINRDLVPQMKEPKVIDTDPQYDMIWLLVYPRFLMEAKQERTSHHRQPKYTHLVQMGRYRLTELGYCNKDINAPFEIIASSKVAAASGYQSTKSGQSNNKLDRREFGPSEREVALQNGRTPRDQPPPRRVPNTTPNWQIHPEAGVIVNKPLVQTQTQMQTVHKRLNTGLSSPTNIRGAPVGVAKRPSGLRRVELSR